MIAGSSQHHEIILIIGHSCCDLPGILIQHKSDSVGGWYVNSFERASVADTKKLFKHTMAM